MTGWLVEQAHLWAAAFIARNLAELFGNWLTIISLSALLVAWALVAGWRLWRALGRLRRVVGEAVATLGATPPDAPGFAAQYEATDARLGERPVLGSAWRDWTATLITPAEPGRPVRATVRPGEYLSLDLLWECGVNPRLHAAMPNLLVGIGLLFTFAGLSLALGAAGGIVGADKAMRESGLRDLLGTASAKFIFSLVGLMCSIAYASFRNHALGHAERELGRFLAALERRIPLTTAATLQTETNVQLSNLADGMSVFSNQLAVSIGERMSDAFDQRLGEHIGPLRDAIDRLATGIGTRGEDTMHEMLEQFLKGLRGGSDEAMRGASEQIATASHALADSLRDGGAEAARQLTEASGALARAASDNAERIVALQNEASRLAATLAEATTPLRGIMTDLTTTAATARDATTALAETGRALSPAGEAVATAAARLTAAEQAAGDLARSLAGAVERFNGIDVELGRAVQTLSSGLNQFADATRKFVADTNDDMGKATTALNGSITGLTDALEALDVDVRKGRLP